MPLSVRKSLTPKAGETPTTTSDGDVPTGAGAHRLEGDVGGAKRANSSSCDSTVSRSSTSRIAMISLRRASESR